jgi:hypothetical protein
MVRSRHASSRLCSGGSLDPFFSPFRRPLPRSVHCSSSLCARTATPATPFLSDACITILFLPPVWGFLLATRHSRLAAIFTRINTYKTASKQTTLTTFRMNAYAKSQGEVPLLLTGMWDSQSWLSNCTFPDYTEHAISRWFAPEVPDSIFPNASKPRQP